MNRRIRALLSIPRYLAPPMRAIATLRGILLAFFVIVAAYYLFPRKQSFTILAPTQSVTVETAANQQHVWSLAGALLCRRLGEEETSSGGLATNRECDPEIYNEYAADEIDIFWPQGYRLSVTGHDRTRLVVEISVENTGELAHFGDALITNNSLLYFERETFDRLGGLVASGEISIGQVAEAGASKLTRGGTYQIRENLWLTGGRTTVAQGDILTGDFVRLTDGKGDDIDGTMFLTRTGNSLADFDVVLTSPPKRSAIEVTRIGGAQTSITTRWTDRLTNDALPAALSIFIGLFGASLAIARSLAGDGTKPKK